MRQQKNPYYPNLAEAMQNWVSPSGKVGLSVLAMSKGIEIPASTLSGMLSNKTHMYFGIALKIRNRYFPDGRFGQFTTADWPQPRFIGRK